MSITFHFGHDADYLVYAHYDRLVGTGPSDCVWMIPGTELED